jgi:drug/metabolite transporter (DMT)-like permease
MLSAQLSKLTSSPRSRVIALACAPALFVFLWSTGWISARAAVIDCDPLTFLAARFSCALLVFAGLVIVTGAPRPVRWIDAVHAIVSGVLLHALYLGGVWWAVGQGVPAGISGVIAATQPILTALLAPMLIGERISRNQWAGILLGLAGVLVVLWPRLAAAQGADFAKLNGALAINLAGMLAVTLGTFYQKRFIPTADLRTTAMLQYVGAVPPLLLAAWLFEPAMRFTVSWTSVATMLWSVLAISLGAIMVYLWLIRNGAVSRAASLIYLVPAATAVEAWLLFGEQLWPVQMLGIVITVAGVALATRR